VNGYATWNLLGSRRQVPLHGYEYFQKFQLVWRAGYSIYLYDASLAEYNRMQKELGLPEIAGTEKTPALW